MGKKRSHQVTRSILKSFPAEAENVLNEEAAAPSGSDCGTEAAGSEGDESEEEDEGEDEEESLDGMSDEDDGFSEDEVDDETDRVDEAEEDQLDAMPQKQRKVEKKELDLGLAMSQILGQKIPATADATGSTAAGVPILAKRKAIERKIEEDRLDARARSVMRKQRIANKDSARVAEMDMSRANSEKGLKKAATRGVVQLFNAIHQHQTTKEKAAKEKRDAAAGGKKGGAEQAAQIKQISKTSFLDMLKGGAAAQLKK